MSTSVERSMKFVYDLHEINFCDGKIIDYVSEGIKIIDNYSQSIALHCIRVSNYSVEIGKQLELSSREIEILWCAAILHDVGKSNTPMEILRKPTKLTKEEYEVIKTHSNKGYEIVRRNKRMEEVSEIILYHHERFNGKGYPIGKDGRSIPLLSRIIAVADAFDAITSERPYRVALSLDNALTELRNGKWTQFDGDIVDCFIDLIEDKCLKSKEPNIDFGLY